MGLSAPAWERRYRRKLFATDTALIAGTVISAQILRFGFTEHVFLIAPTDRTSTEIAYWPLSLALAVGWLVALRIGDTRDPKVYGMGPEEYKRVVNSTLMAFGMFTIIAYSVRAEIGRGYLLIALPMGLFLLILSRYLWRQRLQWQRRNQRNTYRTLIVGERAKSAHIAQEITRSRYAGFELLGAVTGRGTDVELLPGLPVIASYDEVISMVDQYAIDTLIMTSSDAIDPRRLREIGWELEARDVDLILTSALTDVAGPRIHSRPIAGLPLIHVEHPQFTGRKYFLKRLFDSAGAAGLLLVFSPFFLVIASLIKSDSPGPILFRQERIGVGGRRFSMFKFRSMDVDAEARLPGLSDNSDGNGVLFKLKDDPRVTRTGEVLRRYSLDELPQLVNVLCGDMSLVGPRPPLPSEVDSYERWVHRRLLVKPGMTGLWQISGRSDLSWEASVRFDLFYVENWSMTSDLMILLKTTAAVFRARGAY